MSESAESGRRDMQHRPAWIRYGVAVAAVLAATIFRHLLDPWLGDNQEFTLYYAAVALVTWYAGPAPAVLAMVLSLILGDWLFLAPRYSLGLNTLQGWVSYGTFAFASGVVIVFSRLSHLAYQAEQVRATEALNRQLAAADQHKNQFLAMLGHELRNPLAGILNGVQAMKMIGLVPPDAEEMRAVVERQAAHMGRLVDDLLDLSRVARGKIQICRERCNLVAVLRQTLEAFAGQPEAAHLKLSFSLPDRPLWILADPTRISQVVTNLLANAAKFTDPGGQVAVTVAEEDSGAWASIDVKDTGIGMEPEVLSRIFEPFRQLERSLERSRGGLGLGLALVKGLVNLHGGEVTAASAGPGHGSEFRIRLPLMAPGALEPAPVRGPARRVKAYRVLLIDDRRDVTVPLKKMLELDGQTVAVAVDGRSGLETARQFQPEIVLCDIGLPDIDGYEVARQIRADAALKSAYLVALTGYGREEDRRRAAEAGFDYHVIKPVGKQQLDMLLTDLPRFEHGLAASRA